MFPIEKHNNHDCINFIVHLSFVSPDHMSGYQKEHYSHADSKERAIVDALIAYGDEPTPLKGIAVYQCVFAS